MRKHIGAITATAAILGMGLGTGFGYRRPQQRREPSIDEIEERWVHNRMRKLRARQRAAADAIAKLAQATGPWAHRFGYGRHPATREIERRKRQAARKAAKAARGG